MKDFDHIGFLHRHPGMERETDLSFGNHEHVIVDIDDWRNARALEAENAKLKEDIASKNEALEIAWQGLKDIESHTKIVISGTIRPVSEIIATKTLQALEKK